MGKDVSANDLINFGIPFSLFWNTADRDKKHEKKKIIVFAIKRGVNDEILSKFIEYFDFDTVKSAIEQDKANMSAVFYNLLIDKLNNIEN